MSGRQVDFPCGSLVLEGELAIPAGKTGSPAVAVCHPHPLYGGDMDNHVVIAICRALEYRGIATLRFNFRGTGRSAGSHSQGVGEQDDLRAAISYLAARPEIAGDRLGASGYSFGAVVTVNAAAADDRIKAFAAVSLPTRLVWPPAAAARPGPKIFISGSHDQYGPVGELQGLVERLIEPRKCAIIEGADHFWLHGVAQAAREVARFFEEAL
ncbi:MAG: prolyl oligopeptidase family serine peptidase [Chloroflexi bacterium]|nr:prolyl oligopeptidase family serine peptidase [Chloroflexota bacterium]